MSGDLNSIWAGPPRLLLGLAVLLDLLLGEPGNRWHPVAWVGRGLAWARQWAPKGGKTGLFFSGLLLTLGPLLFIPALVQAVAGWTGAFSWMGLLVQAWLLKCTFALKWLILAAREVRTALAGENLEEARRHLGWHLVSRPTGALSVEHVASATVESVAENFTDSIVAPLFFFLLFGLPGAWAYRLVNTADAMWGYREGELEYFGKSAARLDDVLKSLLADDNAITARSQLGDDK